MSLIRCQNGHMFSERRYGTICPYCNIETASKEKKELPPQEFDIESELLNEAIKPVCGWLVCIEGARIGKEYRIKEGKNFVGRADEMDIQILGDNKVSRINHTVVVYDPKKRNFVLLPGDAAGIAYLNDEAVYIPTKLAAYDVIQLGESKFLMVPFCGEHFEWDDING